MTGFCKITVAGNLTRDPEVRFSKDGGLAIVSFGIAYNRKDKQGNNKATFFDVTMFDKRGEAFAKYHAKGDAALLHGEIVQEDWLDKASGERRSKLKLIAHEFAFIKANKGDAAPAPAMQRSDGSAVEPDDIPF